MLEGLDENVIPVEPAVMTYQIQRQVGRGKTAHQMIQRKQFPMTPAYAFTDYHAQGQTLQHVIVDIASPPTGTLSLFNLYVALSQSSGRSTIHLLRDFDDSLFKASHDPALLIEDERLGGLNRQTRQWYNKVCKQD